MNIETLKEVLMYLAERIDYNERRRMDLEDWQEHTPTQDWVEQVIKPKETK